MMTFRERLLFLEKLKVKNHASGTYMCANVSTKTQKDLAAWVAIHNIPNASDPKQYHTTIIYSRTSVPEVKDYKVDLPLTGKITKWEIFKNGDKNCLVALVDCPELVEHHKAIRAQFGATHDYPDFKPHITISYDYGITDVPEDLPSVPIVFTKTHVEPLDTEFTPAKVD
jgi:2'-5' RNA ligase